MEYCEDGNLRELLNSCKKMEEKDALYCLKCLCMGFSKIAKNGIVHRDLKPQNILIKQSQLKICDFGFAKQLLNHRQLTKTTLGSPFYMSPQLLKGQKYSSKCDIWSIGVIYYQLLTGSVPWKGNNLYQLIQKIQGEGLLMPDGISEESQLFLVQALQVKQCDRLSWLEVFQHRIGGLIGQYQQYQKYQQPTFKQIFEQWDKLYTQQAQKLNKIAQKIQIQQLIYVFLQLSVSSLNFDQFTKVMMWLLSQNSQNQTKLQEKQPHNMGIMYQLFDKDCNGVIDIQQFITSFGFKDGYVEMVKVIQRLLEKNVSYEQMKIYEVFKENGQMEGFVEEIINSAYMLVRSIQM